MEKASVSWPFRLQKPLNHHIRSAPLPFFLQPPCAGDVVLPDVVTPTTAVIREGNELTADLLGRVSGVRLHPVQHFVHRGLPGGECLHLPIAVKASWCGFDKGVLNRATWSAVTALHGSVAR